MAKKINNKRTVLITGISSDIGESIARQFIANKWNIIGHYHTNKEKVDQIKKVATKNNVQSAFIDADLTTETGISKISRRISGEKIDCLVNNAGGYYVKKEFTSLTFNDLTKTFGLNVFAPLLITVNIFEEMKKQKYGRIINISSIAAKYGGSRHSLHYGCSKLALEGLTKTLAREGARYNVFVNTVRPGIINTRFHKKFSKDLEKRIKLVPVGRMGTPEEIADMVFFLGSEKNTYITNETVTIAGGE